MNIRKHQGGIYTHKLLIITNEIFIGNLKLFCILQMDLQNICQYIKNDILIYLFIDENFVSKLKFLNFFGCFVLLKVEISIQIF